jgi:hypothetical protein
VLGPQQPHADEHADRRHHPSVTKIWRYLGPPPSWALWGPPHVLISRPALPPLDRGVLDEAIRLVKWRVVLAESVLPLLSVASGRAPTDRMAALPPNTNCCRSAGS